MAEEDQDQKTEAPTSKRLDEAREQGQVPLSRETATWVLLLAILTVVAWLGPRMTGQMVQDLRIFLEMPHDMDLGDRGFQTVMFNTLKQIAWTTVGIFAVLAAAAIAGHMLQTGLFMSLELIRPDFMRLSWKRGFKRIFSTNALAELVKTIAKLLVLGSIAFFTLLPIAYELPSLTGHPLMDVITFLHKKIIHLIVLILVAFTGIAALDLFYQRYQYYKGLRMTKTEVKDEFKQQEGDPAIKARLRQLRIEKARKRMMAQVPKADVVLTNPTHYAIAMQYDSTKMAAPRVVAKGTDRVAERIREVAEEHRIPLVSNPPLARALYDTVDIDREIPTQHYRAVAELISYVYKLKKRKF